MLEEDYLALGHVTKAPALAGDRNVSRKASTLGSQIIKDIILSEIEKKINAGKNFATLRQIFYGGG